ncbi:SRPBCC family protein [Aureibaculum sp. 2210JD6-5]|uniref:SRPBCC family protein n=1 Tax=Aureibaculum sp. 2210JD6-5 TaxID=3103957 RepID=UPI002AAEF886|nr:SRPBCC family protein [Aureibaculum sp. 2210JD6-5]MDY7397056.1 SRPBCC family protein [Aureibaculum sp. 2210JD6-5]
MKGKDSEIVKCQMMIRKPIKEVFNAFIDPKITTNFWFTKSSGKLEKGKTVKWKWEMYDAQDEVKVLDINSNKKITILWGEPKSKVDFLFEALNENQTLVKIVCYDFEHKGKDILATMLDYAGGFTTVLDGLKAYLEHNIELNLIADKYPKKVK